MDLQGDRKNYGAAITGVDGTFDLVVSAGSYRLSVWLDGCPAFYRHDGATTNRFLSTPILVSDADVTDLRFQLPEDVCSARVQGRLLDGESKGKAWTRIRAIETGENIYVEAYTDANGYFSLTAPGEGSYVLYIDLLWDGVYGCSAYYQRGGATTSRNRATSVQVSDGDVWRLQFRLPTDGCPKVTGRLLNAEGEPIAGVNVYGEIGNRSSGWLTDSEGSFQIAVSRPGQHRVWADVDGCEVYYREGEATTSRNQATLIGIDDGEVVELEFQVTEERMCSTEIFGTLVDAEGNPIADAYVFGETKGKSTDVRTNVDGVFAITVTGTGLYRLHTMVNGCQVFYRQDGATMSYDAATLIRVADVDVTGVRFQIPGGICTTRISGRVLDARGDGVSSAWVGVESDGVMTGVQTNSDGRFSVTVPRQGMYRLGIHLGGCWIYYRRDGSTMSYEEAAVIRIADLDVSGLRFQLAKGMCSARISGRVLDPTGTPIADLEVQALPEGGAVSGGRADENGIFSISLPEPGSFRISANVDGCVIYYGRGGVTSLYQNATLVYVSDADVTGITLQVPEDMCELRISGELLRADGSPGSDQFIVGSGGGGHGVGLSDAAGSFSFAVPGRGSYLLTVWIDGCSIYRGGHGPTTDWQRAQEVVVSDADVTGIVFRLPGESCLVLQLRLRYPARNATSKGLPRDQQPPLRRHGSPDQAHLAGDRSRGLGL